MDPLCADPTNAHWLEYCREFTKWALAHGARTSLTQARQLSQMWGADEPFVGFTLQIDVAGPPGFNALAGQAEQAWRLEICMHMSGLPQIATACSSHFVAQTKDLAPGQQRAA